jgi:hypothetical protein
MMSFNNIPKLRSLFSMSINAVRFGGWFSFGKKPDSASKKPPEGQAPASPAPSKEPSIFDLAASKGIVPSANTKNFGVTP